MGFCCSLPRTFFSSSRVFPSWAFCSERELGARAVCWFPFGRSLSKDSAIKEVPAWGFYRTYWCTATHKSPPGSPSKREKWKPAAKCRHACQVLYLAFGSQNMRFSVLTRSRYTFLPRVLFPGFQVFNQTWFVASYQERGPIFRLQDLSLHNTKVHMVCQPTKKQKTTTTKKLAHCFHTLDS